MLLEAMNWMQVEAYLQCDDRVVVVTGACEQHGYLSLFTDIRIPMAIAEVACEREGVLIAPPLPFGISPYFVTYPGTISLCSETFIGVVRDVIEGLLLQGFRRILVSNGHGGNTGVLGAVLTELSNVHLEARLDLFQWWLHPAVNAVAETEGLVQYHANWSENFLHLTRLSTVPEEEKPPVQLSRVASADVTRKLAGDGSFGGPYQVSDAIMSRLFDAAVEAMIEALQAL
jgi:creatinine amidohydrolase